MRKMRACLGLSLNPVLLKTPDPSLNPLLLFAPDPSLNPLLLFALDPSLNPLLLFALGFNESAPTTEFTRQRRSGVNHPPERRHLLF